jgi:integrase
MVESKASRNRVPRHCLHKPSGRGYVRLNGTAHYTGAWGSREAQERYERLLAAWLMSGRAEPPAAEAGPLSYTLECLMAEYWEHAQSYYRHGGAPGREVVNIRIALGPLRDLFGRTLAADFGPLRLMAYRDALVQRGLARSTINQRVGIVCRMFRWAAAHERLPVSIHQALLAVGGLKRGRSEAREPEPVKPVPDSQIAAVLPFLSPTVAAMVQVQNLTGMRSGELIQMRGADLDRIGKGWTYQPASHKTSHLGKERRIVLGAKAQAILRPFLKLDTKAPIFQPGEADQEFRERKRMQRQSKETPSQIARRQRRAAEPKRQFGTAFTTNSYRRAVHRACLRAGIPPWNPHRLRHSAATRVRRECGIEAASAVLGHSSLKVTEIYAERNRGLAEEAMERLG